jgi:hypothetical protein
MKDWIEDALGAVCLFGIGYGLMLIIYGLGG